MAFSFTVLSCDGYDSKTEDGTNQKLYLSDVNPDQYQEKKSENNNTKIDQLLNIVPWTKKEYPNSTVSGHYLAGRFAVTHDDMNIADQQLYAALKIKPDDPYLIQRALPAALGASNFDHALGLARKVQSQDSVIAHLGHSLLVADAFKNQEFKKAEQYLDQLENSSFGYYLKPLASAWMHVAKGDKERAVADLKQLAKQQQSLKALYLMHVAMIYDYSKEYENAVKFYQKSLENHFSARTAWLLGSLYERNGLDDQARDIYLKIQAAYPKSTFTSLALMRLQKQIETPLKEIQLIDGFSSGLFDLANLLYQESSSRLALLYGQIAYYLSPDDPFLQILLGDIFYVIEDNEQAYKLYAGVSPQSDFHIMAQIRLAKLYENEEQIERAVTVLKKLMKKYSASNESIMITLGDLLRRNEEFEDAISYYTQVIDQINQDEESEYWEVFYARAIAYEQTQQWPKAEADLIKSLSIDPNQPYVLNYLGYSWADQGKNIELALEYIEKAIYLRPTDAYIIDSMGWVLYKLGRFKEAVLFLEKAISLLPSDPVINDHLGDVYWVLGRELEAKFQWQKAIDNNEDLEMVAQIKDKLENGLDQKIVFSNQDLDQKNTVTQ